MTSICFYFQVHQPFRLKKLYYRPYQPTLDVMRERLEELYFDREENKYIFEKVANKCYRPANRAILELIDQFKREKRKFRVSYSLSGVFIEQCEKFAPDVLELFKDMVNTGCVEFFDETYYHSLCSLFSKEEFEEQIGLHRLKMKELLRVEPQIFRNTELIYSNVIAKMVENLGYSAIVTEGVEWILDYWRSPDYVYRPENCEKLKLLLKNYRLSDDIAFRFSARWWEQWPLTAEKFAAWLSTGTGNCINLFMDYETFGEHQWAETGIFDFLRSLPYEVLKYENLEFATPSEVIAKYPIAGKINVPEKSAISWADAERDTSAWLGNQMQQLSFSEVKALEKPVKNLGDKHYMNAWRYLQQSDNFYYMSTKGWDSGHAPDGDVHNYFSHYGNPIIAALNYLAVISDFKMRVFQRLAKSEQPGERKRNAKIRMLFAIATYGKPYFNEIALETGIGEKDVKLCAEELVDGGYLEVINEDELALTETGKASVSGLTPQAVDRAFSFYYREDVYTGKTAHNLDEMCEIIKKIGPASIDFHIYRDDLESWIRWIIGDKKLADEIREIRSRNLHGEELEEAVSRAVEERHKELIGGLKE